MKKVLKLLTLIGLICTCSFAFFACSDNHEHSLTKHDALSATCTQDGNKAYYSCDCDKFFEDANAEKQISENSWIIKKTGF